MSNEEEWQPLPQGTRPSNSDETFPRSLVSIAPLFLAMTALGAGLAFFLGWQYEKAYLEEWGLEFSAFSYSPYELMVASSTTVIWAVTVPLVLVVGELLRPVFSLDTFFGPPAAAPRSSPRGLDFVITAMSAVFFVGGVVVVALIALLSDDLRLAMSATWIVLLLMAGFNWQYARAGSVNARWILLSVAVFVLLFILLWAPTGLGRADASDDKEHIERLARVEITLHESLGLDLEHAEGDGVRSGPWRLIRVNDGHLWLTSDANEPTEVIQIDSSDVASVTYLSIE